MQHEMDILINKCNGGTKAPSELRTICSRQTHFLWYCYKRRILQRILSLEGEKPTTKFFNFVFGCYAVYLANGHLLRVRSIRADTIGKYLLAAATLVQLFDTKHRDPRKGDNATALCPQIQKVIAEVRRFEGIANRCEPLDLLMIRYYMSRNAFRCTNSLEAAIIAWFIVGIHGGFRRGELCQENGHAAIGSEELTKDKKIKPRMQAFDISDLEFLTKNKKKLSIDDAMKNADAVWYVRLRFHWQKNLNNGEKKLFVVNTAKPSLCPVRAWLRIVK